ncbi:Retrotransposon gag protein [Corchorus capsularis]|uniref:Retrotransposon gag protein n=1 Tax=Corchorus capsularis TaxID=210143 RepID=A0A1R3JWP7_COCAP|nr:Retrotransposon gag protein [Corchorus capsularis]
MQTRSRSSGNLVYEPDIDKLEKQLKQKRNSERDSEEGEPSVTNSQERIPTNSPKSVISSSTSCASALRNLFDMGDQQPIQRVPTLRELAALDLALQPLCITYTDVEAPFEFKSGFIHLLPKFHGLPGEDPHRYLNEFHMACSLMRPQGVTDEQVKLRAFPFTLVDRAKDWLYCLPAGSVTTWLDMKRHFLEKYFPAHKVSNIRKEISGIRQNSDESLYEYRERFSRLVASCPHHGIESHMLVQYFYEGLNDLERHVIDAASGGSLMNKTTDDANTLIESMAASAQKTGIRDPRVRKVAEVAQSSSRISSIEQILDSTNQHCRN